MIYASILVSCNCFAVSGRLNAPISFNLNPPFRDKTEPANHSFQPKSCDVPPDCFQVSAGCSAKLRQARSWIGHQLSAKLIRGRKKSIESCLERGVCEGQQHEPRRVGSAAGTNIAAMWKVSRIYEYSALITRQSQASLQTGMQPVFTI
jgi:hypothetical protein